MSASFGAVWSAVVWLLLGLSFTNAKILTMRPLNAREVYRLLQQSGRSDAIPQGRVITQGLAAMTGFALGLTKGLGSALLFDIITANVTDLNLNGDGAGSSSNASGTGFTTQEVCFNSRNARSLEEAEAIAEAYSRDDTKEQQKRKVRPSKVERRLKRKRRNKRKSQRHRKPSRLVLKKRPSLATATGIQAGTGTNTETTNPTTTMKMATGRVEKSPATMARLNTEATPTVRTTGSGTNIDNGERTGTTSTSTTSTGNEGAINCVVIQKPAAG